MSYVLTPQQMKQVDQRAINELGIPSRLLMEIAGKGCADYLAGHFPEYLKGRVAILHGTGNNSGDGFVIARWLKHSGVSVALICVQHGTFTQEAGENYEICRKLDIPTFLVDNKEGLTWLKEQLDFCSMVIDAIFGIGFRGNLSPFQKELFQMLGKLQASMIAIDIPSGLNAETGIGLDGFRADCTLAIHAPKTGMLIRHGKHICGQVATITLGVPDSYNEDAKAAMLIDKDSHTYPNRYHDAHKGAYGHVAVIGGSLGYTGSVIMSAKAALRAGAGLVRLHSRMNIQDYYMHLPPEIMFIPLAEDGDSELPHPEILELMLDWADSIVVGPGLGLDAYAQAVLKKVLTHGKVPTVVDADALRLIAEDNSLIKELKRKNILLTPHPGEFCALARLDMEALNSDLLGSLKTFTDKYKARVLLKGDTSIFRDAKRTMFNTSGNDGLATGGSGDVLSGIIASFAAQGLELGKAAINASYLMGRTAEYLATKRLTPSILPTDIIDNLFLIDSQDQS